ncbi:McrB family protein, partial [Cryobacterium sp. MLB-32]|uniref:McrB family protein n=1 Tax=Cryobacterium sp. MLB-32 TaxID=1529318 RepID=UPI00350EC823
MSEITERTGDIDRDLFAIILQLQRKTHGPVNFYDGVLSKRWMPSEGTLLAPESEVKQVQTVPKLPIATDGLAAALFMPRAELQEILDLLQRRQQAVFYGPPGTGKTFLAQVLGRHMVGTEPSRVRMVQFHPSYAYEDFFEGLRPEATAGGVTFSLRPGPLRQIADEAALPENLANPYVLIIDEMNRANLAKVFGELFYLLEYRNEGIRLQYSGKGETFKLPENLF